MEKLNIKKIVVLEDYQSNSYLVWKDNLKSCVVIDCGGEFYKIKGALDDLELEPEAIMLTHGHGDHIAGLNENSLDYYIHKDDREYLFNPELNLSSFLGRPFKIDREPNIFQGNKIYFHNSDLIFEIIHTPGHAPGGCSFLIADSLFSGDTLFLSGIGRTDLPLSSESDLKDSILNKLFKLDRNIKVYPGHGDATTIGNELKSNPFLSIDSL